MAVTTEESADATAIRRFTLEGHPAGNLTRDEVLDNVTLTWLTNTGVSSARLYWENKLGFFDVKGVTIPAAVSVFPSELYQAPRSCIPVAALIGRLGHRACAPPAAAVLKRARMSGATLSIHSAYLEIVGAT